MPERIGPFEVQAELGRGSAGAVFKAVRPPDDRPVAVKVLFPGVLESGGLTRFRREAKALLSLDHPGIVEVLETGSTERGQPYIALAFEPGGSLNERLRRGPLPIAEAVSITEQLAEAVAHAHDQGILHRDLKPHNVLFNAEGRPLITDFGLSRAIGKDERLTRTGEMLGTPSYMPPEQVQGDLTRVGPASDIYGLGGVLYAMLCGRSPFSEATSVVDLLALVLNTPPPPPRSLRPEVAPALEAIVLRCLAKDPEERYADARSLADALRAWRGRAAQYARPAPARSAEQVWGVRLALAGGCLFLVAGGVLTAFVVRQQATSGGPAVASTTPPPAETSATSSATPSPTPSPTRAIDAETQRRVAAETQRRVVARLRQVKQLIGAGDYQGALEAAEHAVRLRRDVETLSSRMAARFHAGRLADALTDSDALIAAEPKNPTFYIRRGHVHARLEAHAKAKADYETALRVAPDDPNALAALGWALWSFEKQPDRAEELWTRSVAARPTPDGLAGLAAVAHRAKRWEEALKQADAALKLEDIYLKALVLRASSLLNLQRLSAACAAYEVLVTRHPEAVDWQLTYLKLAWELKDHALVLGQARRALKQAPARHPKRQALVELVQRFRESLGR